MDILLKQNVKQCLIILRLFRTKLYQMCKCSEVQDFIRKVDYTFYQNLVEVLMPNVLRPIPSESHSFLSCIFALALRYFIDDFNLQVH